MKIIPILILIFLISCQPTNFSIVESKHENYNNIRTIDGELFALGTDKTLVKLDFENKEIIDLLTGVECFDSYFGELVYADTSGQVNTFNLKTKRTKNLTIQEDQIIHITSLDSAIYLLTKTKLLNLLTGMECSLRDSPRYNYHFSLGYRPEPYVVESDDSGNIWMGYNYGEFGGELLVFNTRKNQFDSLISNDFAPGAYGIESIVPAKSRTLITFGEGHSLHNGMMEIIGRTAEIRLLQLDSLVEVQIENDVVLKLNDRTEIGPATYDPKLNQVYFYSEGRIMMNELSEDISNLENWRVSADLNEFNDLGFRTKDLELEDHFEIAFQITELIFLGSNLFAIRTRENGLAVYDNGTITLFK